MQNLQQLIKQTGLSYSQLSLKLNKNKKYISWVLANGLSTKRQAELEEEIKTIIAGGVVKTNDMIIAELSERLSEVQDGYAEAVKAVNEVSSLHMQLTNENTDLKESNIKLTNANEDLKKSNISLMEESDSYHNTNTELNAELNAARETIQELEYAVKTSQNDAERILELKTMVDTIDSQNDELRATIGKQRILGFIALITMVILALLLVLDSKFLFWM